MVALSISFPETSDTDDVMDDIMLKREKATNFLQRDRRDLNHECYSECCNWEEVREHYEHDIAAAVCMPHYRLALYSYNSSYILVKQHIACYLFIINYFVNNMFDVCINLILVT